jgi:cobalt-precorrin 5A hydrolase
LSAKSIRKIATTRVKADEQGILELSKKMSIPIDFYGKDALNSVKNIQTPSQMVESHMGVKSVCEAAAILSANTHTLIVTKHKNRNVTVAVAI